MSNWQILETAPKDGTPILGFADGDYAVVCWEREDIPKGCGYWSLMIAGSFAESAEWWPTHWQPLPPPPPPTEGG